MDHYYLWETMTHIRMILKHLCLSGMVGIIQAKITWFWGYILLRLLCSILLISTNFTVKSIIFSKFWPGAFSQNCRKKHWLIMVAQETGWCLAWSETPKNNMFSRPYYTIYTVPGQAVIKWFTNYLVYRAAASIWVLWYSRIWIKNRVWILVIA